MITEKEILDGNKLILLFEGFEYVNDDTEAYPNGYYYNKEFGTFVLGELQYHESWDWLIPVIEKISKIPIPNAEHRQDVYYPRTFGMINEETGQPMFRFYCCSVFEAETLIEAAWLAVVDFIKSYKP